MEHIFLFLPVKAEKLRWYLSLSPITMPPTRFCIRSLSFCSFTPDVDITSTSYLTFVAQERARAGTQYVGTLFELKRISWSIGMSENKENKRCNSHST